MRRKLLSVLDATDFSQDMPELLQLDFFERTQIEQVISNCEHVNEQGHTVCNVKVGFQMECAIFIFLVLMDSVYLFFYYSCARLLIRSFLTVASQSAGCRGKCFARDGSNWAEAFINGSK